MVTFTSRGNLTGPRADLSAPDDTNDNFDVYVRSYRDPAHPVTQLVSQNLHGQAGDNASQYPTRNRNLQDP